MRAAAAASERLFARHHRMVLGLCRGLLRDPAEAEDAAQQAFLSAHRSLLNGAEPREPAAWLATIARNECWARIRGRMREPLPSDAADAVAGTGDPVAEAIRNADLAALWRAIRALPRAQRDALLLREFGGLRYDELAVALAVSEPAVESLLVRARSRVRAQLKTVYASLAPLARLLASGGGPAVATKAVALGLGAAAVTGTAVVAPTMLERHPAHHSARLPATARPHVRHVSPVAAELPHSTTTRRAVPPTIAAVAIAVPPRRAQREVERERLTSDRGETSGSDRSRDGSDGGDRAPSPGAVTTAEQHDGHGGGGGSGSSGSDGSGSGSDGGSDGGHDGSSGPATTTPLADASTIALPTVTAATGSNDGGGGDSGSDGGHG